MSYDSQKVIPAKIPTRKNDLAPILFFIDVIKSPTFLNPIIPLPLRIDKITNRLETCLVYPSTGIQKPWKDQIYSFNLTKIYDAMITNLVYYAKQKYREMTFRELEDAVLLDWWEKSTMITAQLPRFQEDITSMLTYYLDAYLEYLESHDECLALMHYCMQVVELCNRRIDENHMNVLIKQNPEQRPMYMKKKDKIYPNIIESDVFNAIKQKNESRAFVPLLIYDDLLECFLSNQVELEGKTKEIITFDQTLREFILIYDSNSASGSWKNIIINFDQIDIHKILEQK